MRIGIVTKWFASGQAVVSRQIRSGLDGLGHETFIFAKPGKGPRANQERVADPVWDQPGVTFATEADPSADEYRGVGTATPASTRSSTTRTTSSPRSRRCEATACGRSGASSGRASPRPTRRRRSAPTTSSTRSRRPSRRATRRSGSRARTSPGESIRSCSRSPIRRSPTAPATTSSGSSSRARSWASESRFPRSSRRSAGPRTRACGCSSAARSTARRTSSRRPPAATNGS